MKVQNSAPQGVAAMRLFTATTVGLLAANFSIAHAQEAANAVDGVTVQTQRNVSLSPKTTTPLRDTPKSITVIPEDIINSTGSATLAEALRTVPGITFGAGEGGNPVGDRPFLRGYDAQSSTFLDGLRDIGAQSREVFNVQSIEVIKGAAGSYAGRGGAGGGIYINSKAPMRDTFANLSGSLGNASYKRATFDGNYAFSDTGAVRLNAMWFDAGVAGRDVVKNSRWGIAPSVAFGLGTPTRATISFYHLRTDDIPDAGIPYNNPTFNARTDRVRVAVAGDGQPIDVDRNTFYGLKDRDFRKEGNDTGTIRIEHDLTPMLHLRNTTRYSETTQDYVWTQPDDSQGNLYYGLIYRRFNSRVSQVKSLINQTDFYGVFETGSIKHNFATGLELSREEGENDSYAITSGGVATASYNRCALANSLSSYNCTTVVNPNPNDPWVGQIVRNNNPTNARTDTKALYAFDTIELNPQFQLNLGLRYDDYSATFTSARAATTPFARSTFNRKDKLWNYQAALVYKPTTAGALYVSYATASTPAGASLVQGSEATPLSSDVNGSLSPEKNHTLEAGAKWDVFGGKLALTGAVFEVKTTNSRITLADATVAMAGEKRVRGFEVGASGSITDKWDIFGGYTYLDAILVKAGGAAAAFGLQDGQPFPNTPKNSLAIWTTYRILPKLSVGGGANYMSKVMGSTNPALPKFIPGYWRFDLNANYEISQNLNVQLNIQNLTDKVYFNQAYPTHYASIAPGRSAFVTLNAKF